MDADPELKAAILGLSGARLCELILNRNGALDGIDRARKLRQHAVASRVGDPPAMIGMRASIISRAAPGRERPSLVLAYEAEYRDVRGEDRCQTSFNPLSWLRMHSSNPGHQGTILY